MTCLVQQITKWVEYVTWCMHQLTQWQQNAPLCTHNLIKSRENTPLCMVLQEPYRGIFLACFIRREYGAPHQHELRPAIIFGNYGKIG